MERELNCYTMVDKTCINIEKIRESLEKTLFNIDFQILMRKDPVKFLWKFSNHKDKEIAGWVSSSLAYGSRKVFLCVLEDIFTLMGNRPYLFVKKFNFIKDGSLFRDVKYRFNNGWDIAACIEVLHRIFLEYDTMNDFFLSFDSGGGQNVLDMASKGVQWMRNQLSRVCSESVSYGVAFKNPFFLFPSAKSAGPMKRVMLFFRWMCRNTAPDSGLWSHSIEPSRLIVPLDVHMFRTARRLKLVSAGTPSRKAALELTAFFSLLDKDDPIKYDFPLMSWVADNCPSEKIICIKKPDECPLAPLCKQNISNQKCEKENRV